MKKHFLAALCATALFASFLPAQAQEDQITRYLDNIQQDVGMRSGTFWPLYEMVGKVFYEGNLIENLYDTPEEMRAAVPVVGSLTPMSPAMIDYLLAQDGMAVEDFPYTEHNWMTGTTVTIATPKDYITEGIRDGWMTAGPGAPEALPTYIPPSLDSILNDPQKVASVIGHLSSLTTDEINELINNTSFTPETAVAVFSAIQLEKTTQPGITKAYAPFFGMAIDPAGPLYANRSAYDFRGGDLTGFPIAGSNVSDLQITANQLNDPSPDTLSPCNYTGTNFSGMDMTGFSPVNRGLSPLGGSGPDNRGGTFINTNLSNVTNLDPAMLARAPMFPPEAGNFNGLKGAILTGSNVTRETLRAALITNMQNNQKVQYNSGFWTQQKLDSFVDGILNEVTF